MLLNYAVKRLIASTKDDPKPEVLWSMHYQQSYDPSTIVMSTHPNVVQLPSVAPSFVLEDDILRDVRAAYESIMGDNAGSFMNFDDREGAGTLGDDDADTNS